MKNYFKRFLIILACVSPWGWLRRKIYNIIPGYRIHATATVGMLTYIDVDEFRVDKDASTGKYNIFSGPISVALGQGARIDNRNIFHAGDWVLEPRFAADGYKRSLAIGEGCLITTRHFFDVSGAITIGDGAWIAGRGSEFWTHGLSARDRDITIGRLSYVGSGVKFAPGASVGDLNIVALGSVVAARMEGDAKLIGGVPARQIKDILPAIKAGEYKFNIDFEARDRIIAQVEASAQANGSPRGESPSPAH